LSFFAGAWERREVGGTGYSQLLEANARPCSEMALTAGTPNVSTLPRLSKHHRYLLAFHLRRVEAIEADLRTLDERVKEKARPYAAQRHLLRQIPGVDGAQHLDVADRIVPLAAR
jgi:transposase